MEVGAYLVADAEPLELVEPGKVPLDKPPGLTQAGAMRGSTAGDLPPPRIHRTPREVAGRVRDNAQIVFDDGGPRGARPAYWETWTA